MEGRGQALWLRVRLTGKAQTPLKQLPAGICEGAYKDQVEGLCQHHEPDSRRKLYAAKFHSRRKHKGKSWADFGDDLSRLVSKAYPDLGLYRWAAATSTASVPRKPGESPGIIWGQAETSYIRPLTKQ